MTSYTESACNEMPVTDFLTPKEERAGDMHRSLEKLIGIPILAEKLLDAGKSV
jgi:hypothetical protein